MCAEYTCTWIRIEGQRRDPPGERREPSGQGGDNTDIPMISQCRAQLRGSGKREEVERGEKQCEWIHIPKEKKNRARVQVRTPKEGLEAWRLSIGRRVTVEIDDTLSRIVYSLHAGWACAISLKPRLVDLLGLCHLSDCT